MYQLRLYKVDATKSSIKAVQELEALLESKFKGQYSLETIDVLQEPDRSVFDRVLVTPTVVKTTPGTERRIVGSLSDSEKVLAGLDLV